MMNGRTEISITQRVAKLDAEICGDKIRKKMIREAARYAKDVRDYIKTGAISNEMKVGTKEDGGYLVPDEMAAGLVEALEEANCLRKISNIIKTSKNLKVNLSKSHVAAAWIEEGQQLEFSDETFDQVMINAYKAAVLLQISDELAEDAGFDVVNYAIKEAGKAIGKLEEAAFINGDGIGKPTGLLTDAQVGVEVSQLDGDAIYDLLSSLSRPYRKNAVWIMNDSTEKEVQKMKNSYGKYLWEESVDEKTPNRLLGLPVYVADAMPQAIPGNIAIALGDFSYFWIGDRGNRSIKRLNELFAVNGLFGIRVSERVDARLVRPEAVKTLKIAA